MPTPPPPRGSFSNGHPSPCPISTKRLHTPSLTIALHQTTPLPPFPPLSVTRDDELDPDHEKEYHVSQLRNVAQLGKQNPSPNLHLLTQKLMDAVTQYASFEVCPPANPQVPGRCRGQGRAVWCCSTKQAPRRGPHFGAVMEVQPPPPPLLPPNCGWWPSGVLSWRWGGTPAKLATNVATEPQMNALAKVGYGP